MEREATKKLASALGNCNTILSDFMGVDIVVPEDLKTLKANARQQIDAYLTKFKVNDGQDDVTAGDEEEAGSTMLQFVEDIAPGLADGTLMSRNAAPTKTKTKTESESAGDGDGAGDGDEDEEGALGGANALFAPGPGPAAASGNDDGGAEENLQTFLSNLAVAVNKIVPPLDPMHELHEQVRWLFGWWWLVMIGLLLCTHQQS